MEMPGLSYSAADYRYGFNSKEKDSAFGLLHYDYGFRIYHPGLGRFLSVDPLAGLAPDWSPFRFGFDNPVLYTDPFGLFESKQAAKDFKEEQGIKGRIRRDGDVFYIKERGNGSQYAFGSTAGGYGTKHSTSNSTGYTKGFKDGMWGLFSGSWAEDGRGEKFAQTMADLNPAVQLGHAYGGFTSGKNIYDQEITN